MKIGIFDPYLNTLGGGEKYMLTAASFLSKRNDVFIFWDEYEILSKAHDRFAIDLENVLTAKNIFSSEISFMEKLKISSSFDLIFYLSDGSIPFVLSKKLFLHFQFPVEWVKDGLASKLKMMRVSRVICNSFFTKKHIDNKFGIYSSVIYPPSTGETEIKELKKENIILTVGRLQILNDGSTFKKQETIIKMFQQMIDSGLKRWKLVLVISYQENKKKEIEFLKDMIKNYPIEIRENVSSSELSKLYGKSKIYWHAAGFGKDLDIHPELAEHFGIATVQAMEQGTVPLVFNGGGQSEIVIDSENGFLWSTEKEFIEKTLGLMGDKKTWIRLSKNAKIRAKNFSLEKFYKNLNEIFK